MFEDSTETTCYESALERCGSCTGCFRSWLPCCCCWCPYPYQSVRQGTIGLKERFGRWEATLDPGLHYINPCTESLQHVTLLTRSPICYSGCSTSSGRRS
jgi:erythrocyte band 7 integral membrane protein